MTPAARAGLAVVVVALGAPARADDSIARRLATLGFLVNGSSVRAAVYALGCAGLGFGAATSRLAPWVAGTLGFALSVSVFAEYVARERRTGTSDRPFLADDRLLAGALVGGATFVLIFFA